MINQLPGKYTSRKTCRQAQHGSWQTLTFPVGETGLTKKVLKMLFLIGIDDTDNLTSGDTDSLAQRLGAKIESTHTGRMVSVTCHQLAHHPNIIPTSQNQCFCLLIDADRDTQRDIELICRTFLMHESAAASNAGFALAAWNSVTPAITAWGRQAKSVYLDRQEAMNLARDYKISIAGFTGSGQGVVGALAAVGLYYDGNDGKFTWLEGLRSLKGIFTLTKLIETCAIDRVENLRGRKPMPDDHINVSEEAYPILRDGQSLLLVEPSKKDETWEWNTISAEKLKHFSS